MRLDGPTDRTEYRSDSRECPSVPRAGPAPDAAVCSPSTMSHPSPVSSMPTDGVGCRSVRADHDLLAASSRALSTGLRGLNGLRSRSESDNRASACRRASSPGNGRATCRRRPSVAPVADPGHSSRARGTGSQNALVVGGALPRDSCESGVATQSPRRLTPPLPVRRDAPAPRRTRSARGRPQRRRRCRPRARRWCRRRRRRRPRWAG